MSADQHPTGTDVPVQAASRIRELESELAVCKVELGNMKLQLDVMTTTDPVTGLPNLHGIVELIEDATHRRYRSGECFGVLAVRIKSLEDIYGRLGTPAFKEATRHVGALIAAGLRQVDRVGRLDNTTFVGVMPELDADGVSAVLDRIETTLTASPLTFGADEVIAIEPELSVVLSPKVGQAAPAAIIDAMFDAREKSGPGARVITTAAPTDAGFEVTIP